MKFGPLTFQCACLVCVCRSMQSASRALSSSTTLTRVASGRSFFVLNMVNLLNEARENLLGTSTTGRRIELAGEQTRHACRLGAEAPVHVQHRPGDVGRFRT